MRTRRVLIGALLLVLGSSLAAGILLHQSRSSMILRMVSLGKIQAANAVMPTALGSFPEILQRQRIVVDPRTQRVYVVPLPNGDDDIGAEPPGGWAIFTFSSLTGTLLARTTLHGTPFALVPDAVDGRLLFLESGLAAVGVLGAAGGRLYGAIPLDYAPSALAVDDQTGAAYAIGGITPTLSIINVQDQRVLHDVRLGPGQPEWIAVDARAGRVLVGSVIIGPGSAVATRLSMLSARDGRLLHTLTVPGAALVPTMDSRRGRLYLSRDGDLLVVDSRRGILLRAIAVDRAAPTVSHDMANGYVDTWLLPRAAVDAKSGHLLLVSPFHRHPWLMNDHGILKVLPIQISPFATQIAVNDALGQYVVSDGRRTMVLDAGTGAVLESMPLPAGDDVAVDQATDHAFVLSMETQTITPADPWGWVPDGLRRQLPFLPHRPAPYQTLGTLTSLDLSR